MTKLVNLTLTDTDCLSLRLALNATAMEWGDKASASRAAGDDVEAATCERIRAEYGALWELVRSAQEAPGRAPDFIARRERAADPLRPLYDRQSVARYGS